MRMSFVHRAALLLLILAAIATVGCSRKATKVSPAAAATPPMPAVHAEPSKVAAQPPAPPPPAAAALKASDFADVRFDFNQSDLRQDGRDALDADARLLREHPEARITIEGHCDERGTIEYNEALGERRADAARDYLVTSGVSTTAISTISYGKDRPFCTEHDEACWAKNRCAHMVLKNGPA